MKPEKKFKRQEKKSFFTEWRFYIVYGFIFVAMFGLAVKLALLQIVDPDRLIAEGDKRSIRHQEVEVPRGMITDRSGRALAVSVPMEDVWVDPKVIQQKGGVDVNDSRWQAFAESVGVPVHDLAQRLNNTSSRFVRLARQITPAMANYIRQLKLTGVYFDGSSKRFYPASESVAQLIGFTDIEGKGAEGIERSLNSWLTGESGQRTVRRDRFGRVIENLGQIDGEAAQDLVLSIDERLQTLAYREISQAVAFNKADSGTAVVVDIQTGEILAMATSPSYNPNNRIGITGELLRNRAVTDAFEPGSTVKPLVVIAALENKAVQPTEIIDTRPFYVNRYEVKDVSPQRQLSLEGILQKSSNVGVSRLALRMEPQTLVDYYSKVGLGQPTNLGLGGESRGTIAANRARWSDIERATFAFGYGLMATPLQLARAYATIGSFGIYRPLSITRVDEPVPGVRVLNERITRDVVKMMESVAVSGGGVRAAVPGYSVAVKTGTAKKVGESGKYINEYIAYTAGIAPASNPRYSLVVIIDNPKAGQYYGGTVSAPVFSHIMGGVLRTMNIEPDRQAENPLIVH
ncbi:peptidoglycan glycosyltransferase FtsI [Zophobihabitans entericus]|uniref:Peptidoglycan D,D-transpeptidase FtsI n=1 Tax=Zophobihabitans entericus TaxID=1635327 RepID=A0A6G9I9S0_9GAMM|nr:peptidoglycan glycosyltransferase FtsI [Zophobihabitans entericus]QIQ20966.1 peptidoglycan glycosyltransferase FtsI [Zophobihabitans entericus]